MISGVSDAPFVILNNSKFIRKPKTTREAIHKSNDFGYFGKGTDGYNQYMLAFNRSNKGGGPKKDGCYIATAVYGSYDCPEVWTLRRFRDYRLKQTVLGRAFVRCYYAVSPALVKGFGSVNWLKRLVQRPLDRLVASLKAEGIDDTPYSDFENQHM